MNALTASALALLLALPATGEETTPPRNPIVGTDTQDGLSSTTGGISIQRRPAGESRKVTYIVVSPVREWRDVEDRKIRASLVAFDVPAATSPEAEAEAPKVLVRDGKVRLWVEGSKKVSEFPLSRLSEEDQSYVRRMVASANKPAGDPPADAE